MPKLNSVGEMAGGIVGSTEITANGVTYCPVGTGVNWLTDDIIIYQGYRAEYVGVTPEGWAVEQTNIRTGVRTQLADYGANSIIAGGNRWCGWLAGTGVFGAYTSAVMGLGAGARDGTLALVPDYQADVGMVLYGPTGQQTLAPSDRVVRNGFNIISPTSAIWTYGGAIEGLNVTSLPLQIGAAWTPIALQVGSEWWITYWCDEYGQVLHPYDTLEGYVVEGTPHCFWPDAVVTSDDHIHVAYSYYQGEILSALIHKEYTLAETRTTFTPSSSFVLPDASTRIFAAGSTSSTTGTTYPPLPHPMIDARNGLVSRPWAVWFQQEASRSLDLSLHTTGTLRLASLPTQPAATLLGRNAQLSGTPEVIRLGSGLQMQGSVLVANPSFYNAGDSGVAKTMNWALGSVQGVTVTASTDLTFTNPVDGGRYVLVLQTGTGGHTVSWPADVRWTGTTPTVSAGANVVDVFTFYYVSAYGLYFGSAAQGYAAV